MKPNTILLALALVGVLGVPTWAAPDRIHHQGLLKDDAGVPVTDPVDLEFTIFDAATGGTALWTETHAVVVPTDGVFSVQLGATTPLDETIFGGDRWLETSVDGVALDPRQPFLSTAFALRAAVADVALTGGGEADDDWVVDGDDVYRLDGNVGVSTTAPLGKLHVVGGTAPGAAPPDTRYDHLVIDDDEAAYINLRSGNDAKGGVLFSDDARAAGYIRYDHADDDLEFFTAASGGGNQHLTIDGAGNIGIGTPDPSRTLHVVGDDLGLDDAEYPPSYDAIVEAEDATLALYGGPSGVDGSKIALAEVVGGDITDYWYIIRKTDGDLAIQNNSTEILRCAPNGNVGIGTSSPSHDLDVAGVIHADGLDVSGTAHVNGGVELASVTDPSVRLSVVTFPSSNANGLMRYTELGGDGSIVFSNGTIGAEVERFRINSTGVFVNGTATSGQVTTDVLQITGGADLAEPFRVRAADRLEPGMVLAIDPDRPGELRIADRPYDRTVAGIASGAKGIRPGITLRQDETIADGSIPVALTGRVYCLADATGGAISPGDLLTSSSTPGYAMRVADAERAHGATLGKAMTALESGRGHVLVLVTLH